MEGPSAEREDHPVIPVSDSFCREGQPYSRPSDRVTDAIKSKAAVGSSFFKVAGRERGLVYR